jgi:GDP-4-dehydro-6-deoxy-D-mannose reductase
MFPCDLRRGDQVRVLVRDVRPQQVYHLGAMSSVQDSFESARLVHESNFCGTFNLLDALGTAQTSPRVLLVSSGHSYGPVKRSHLPIRETEALNPDSPYGVSKAAADMLGSQFFRNHGLRVIRARPFNHTGPGQSPHFVCSDFAKQFAAIELEMEPPIVRVGNIGAQRDFSDVRDVVRAYVMLINKGTPGEAYNVGSGRAVSLRQILAILQSLCSRKVQIEVEKRRLRRGETTVSFCSIRKLKQVTGWHPKFDLRDTLRDLYLYWKEAVRRDKNLSINAEP